MLRCLIVAMTLVVSVLLPSKFSTSVFADGHHHRSRSRTSSNGSFGFSIGVGTYPGYGYSSYGYSNYGNVGYGYSGFGYPDPYRFDGFGYDPYRYGSFHAPDLMNDPYFKAQHKYDSRFPGRRSGYPPLEIRPVAPASHWHHSGN